MVLPIKIITPFVIPILSLSGLLAGMLLSYIAHQELSAGKKYFCIGR